MCPVYGPLNKLGILQTTGINGDVIVGPLNFNEVGIVTGLIPAANLPSMAQGPQGSPGPPGNIGATGIQGVPGIQGIPGIQGVQGLQGTTGLQGATGIQGPTGPGAVAAIFADISIATNTVATFQSSGFNAHQWTGLPFTVANLQNNTTFAGNALTMQAAGTIGIVVAFVFVPTTTSSGKTCGFQIFKNGTGCGDSYQEFDVSIGGSLPANTGIQIPVTLTTIQNVQVGDVFTIDFVVTNNNIAPVVLTFQGGTWSTFSIGGVQGIQGPTGGQGATGAQGSAGAQGTQGATGLQGATGIQGPTGGQGATGAQGTAGATGIQGPVGTQGSTGAQGSPGVTGPPGPTGTAGATGVQGPTGPGAVSSIYADISIYSGLQATFVGTGANRYTMLPFSVVNQINNATFAGNTLTVTQSGELMIVVAFSFVAAETTQAAALGFQIYHNGLPCPDSFQIVQIATSSAAYNIALTTIQYAAAGDTFTVDMASITNSSNNRIISMTIEGATWTTQSIGGVAGIQGPTGAMLNLGVATFYTPATMEFTPNNVVPIITQATAAGTTGLNLVLIPQQGTITAGNVQGGNVVVGLQAPTGTGNEAALTIMRGDSTTMPADFVAAIGPDPGNPTYSCLWLLPGAAPTANNFVVREGVGMAINDPSGNAIAFYVNLVQAMIVNSSVVQFVVPIAGSSANPLVFQANPTSFSVATGTYTMNNVQYQYPTQSLTGTAPVGGCVITLPNVVGAIWHFDFSKTTLTGNVTFTTGSGTTAVITSTILASGKLIVVSVTSSNVVSASG